MRLCLFGFLFPKFDVRYIHYVMKWLPVVMFIQQGFHWFDDIEQKSYSICVDDF